MTAFKKAAREPLNHYPASYSQKNSMIVTARPECAILAQRLLYLLWRVKNGADGDRLSTPDRRKGAEFGESIFNTRSEDTNTILIKSNFHVSGLLCACGLLLTRKQASLRFVRRLPLILQPPRQRRDLPGFGHIGGHIVKKKDRHSVNIGMQAVFS